MRRFNVLVCHRRFGKQDVIAWHRHPLGGASAWVRSLTAIPAADHDRLWLAVERIRAGQPLVSVEFLERGFWADTIKDIDTAFFVDSGLSYDGWNNDMAKIITIEGGAPWVAGSVKSLRATGQAPFVGDDIGRIFRIGAPGLAWPPVGLEVTGYTAADLVTVRLLDNVPAELQQRQTPHWARTVTSLAGLDHLEGESLRLLVDGAAHPDRAVVAGSIVLDRPAAVVHAGLGYESRLETLNLEAGAADGTAVGKQKRIHRATVRLFASLGCRLGFDDAHLEELQFRGNADAMDQAPPLFSGDRAVAFPKGWDTEARVLVVQSQPLPLTVAAIAPHLTTNG
jgi:hypothetical protein